MNYSVSAILLAAGLSKRMGTMKQLLPLSGKPVILHCIDAIFASGINDTVVVLSPQGKAVEQVIQHLPLSIVFNNDPSSEMAESIRIGLRSVNPSSTGILICLSDHPLVTSDTLKTLIECHRKEPDKIIIPVYQSRKGHPNLFPEHVTDEIFQGCNLRDIVNKDKGRIQYVNVPDEGILFDMNSEEDYRRIAERVT